MKRQFAASVGLLISSVALAQPSAVEVGQISSSTKKIDAQPLALLKPVVVIDEQLTASDDRVLIAPSPEAKEAARAPVQQLTRGKPSAEAAPALSRREQSRPGANEVLDGADRCDPAERRGARPPGCARVIESRSAEFDRTPPPLSPEQRLLLEQQVLARDAAYERATRRLANSGTGDRSLDEQAVASVALGRNAPPPAPKKEEDPSAGLSQEQAAAIVGAILNPPPR